jgi:hypothetical protein
MEIFSLKPYIKPSLPTLILILSGVLGIWVVHLLILPEYSHSVSSFENFSWPAIYHITALLAITAVNSVLIRRFVLRFAIIRVKSFLPVFFYLTFTTVWAGLRTELFPHVFLTAFIISTEFFFGMFRNRVAVEHAFLTSLIISATSVIEPLYTLIFPLVWIGYVILKSMSLRVWLASVFGLSIPWLLFNSYYWFKGVTTGFSSEILFILQPSLYIPANLLPLLIYATLTGIIAVIGVGGMFNKIFDDTVQTRKYIYILVMLITIITLFSIFYQPYAHLFLPLIAFLLSVLIAHPFTLSKSDFYPVLFIFFIVLNLLYLVTQYFNITGQWAV